MLSAGNPSLVSVALQYTMAEVRTSGDVVLQKFRFGKEAEVDYQSDQRSGAFDVMPRPRLSAAGLVPGFSGSLPKGRNFGLV